MRTTVTLDPDAEQLLRLAMQQSGESFKATINRAIRKGLVDTTPPVAEEPFVVDAQPMGLRAGIDPTKLQDLADQQGVEAFIDLSTRLPNQLRNRSDSS